VDTETGGLNFRTDPLLMVQLGTAIRQVYMVRFPDESSVNLIRLLTYPFLRKIFHHAGFDLRFLKAGLLRAVQGPVDCTKTLMKIVNPQRASGLGAAVRHHFGVKLDKDVDHSCWSRQELTDKEIQYAAGDVLYLDHMANVMKAQLTGPQQVAYARSISAIRDAAILEVEGYTDLLGYKKDKGAEVLANRAWWDKKVEEDRKWRSKV